MSLFVATNAGAKLVLDSALDSVCDRTTAMARHIGSPSSWTASTGSIVAIRDGAEVTEVEVAVAGVFSGHVELRAPGPLVLAVSPALTLATGEKTTVFFRIARARAREIALAGAP